MQHMCMLASLVSSNVALHASPDVRVRACMHINSVFTRMHARNGRDRETLHYDMHRGIRHHDTNRVTSHVGNQDKLGIMIGM